MGFSCSGKVVIPLTYIRADEGERMVHCQELIANGKCEMYDPRFAYFLRVVNAQTQVRGWQRIY